MSNAKDSNTKRNGTCTSVWSTVMPQTSRLGIRGDIRRCFDPTVNPEMGRDGCRTMYEGLRHGAAINPLGPCLGFRAVSTTGLATPFIYSSYTEVVARVNALAAGLDVLRLVPPNPDNIKLLGLYMPNCIEWVTAEHAIFTLGGATVPLYDTRKFHVSTASDTSVCCFAIFGRFLLSHLRRTQPRFFFPFLVLQWVPTRFNTF